MFVYVRDRTDPEGKCSKIEKMLQDEDVRMFLNENCIVYGVDVNTTEGISVSNVLGVAGWPYLCIVVVKESGALDNVGEFTENAIGDKEALMGMLVQGIEQQSSHNDAEENKMEEDKKAVDTI